MTREPRPYDWLSPVTILPDRYGGTYSGHAWLAFPCEPWSVPEGPFGGDAVAAQWWADAGDFPIGRGASPDEAYTDVMLRLALVEPSRVHPADPSRPFSGAMWTWLLRWPDGEERMVDRCWRGDGVGPRNV